MSTDWTVFFDETLAKYVWQYIEARGDPAARSKILKDCEEEISNSPLHEQYIELPQLLCEAICTEFLPYLDDDDSKEEKAKLAQLEECGEESTPEMREAAARPQYAKDYKNKWNAYRVAQRLFSSEVDQIDSESRDKKDKKSIGDRTLAVRKWFNELPRSKIEEAKKVAEKWNTEGCPNKERQATYRNKNLKEDTVSFIDSVRRKMGVHCVVLAGFDAGDGWKTTLIEPTLPPSFSLSSKKTKAWALQGAQLFNDYLSSQDEDPEKDHEKSKSDEEEDEEVHKVTVDNLGHPILPTHPLSIGHLKLRQDVVRDVFTKAYMRITKRDKVHVPWLELGKVPAKYLDMETIPKQFKVLDPSKLTKDMVSSLFHHWARRECDKKPILVFIKARDQDLGPGERRQTPQLLGPWDDSDEAGNTVNAVRPPPSKRPRLSKQPAVDTDDTDDADDADNAVRPPPSKRPRLSKQPAVPDKQSPAANDSNEAKFLYSLSGDQVYKTLVDGMLSLPYYALPQSSSLAPKPKLSLPVWASWNWDQKYLPEDIHTKLEVFQEALGQLHKYEFADQGYGEPAVLGFGLLLRECWRAVEAEDDDENCPKFLQGSLLNEKRVRQVTKAIKDVIGRLPLQVVDEERPKEKKSEGGAKGPKARCVQEKPGPSAGKSTAARKVDGSPIKRNPSQRQRMPSRKLRVSE